MLMLQQLCLNFVPSSTSHKAKKLDDICVGAVVWTAVWSLTCILDHKECQCCCCLLPTSFFLLFLLPLPFFLFSPHPSLSLSLSLFTIAPSPSSSCRYLTPCVKSEYYVTKWVEDVNKNTEGPFIRYNNIRLHYICPLSISFPPQLFVSLTKYHFSEMRAER